MPGGDAGSLLLATKSSRPVKKSALIVYQIRISIFIIRITSLLCLVQLHDLSTVALVSSHLAWNMSKLGKPVLSAETNAARAAVRSNFIFYSIL